MDPDVFEMDVVITVKKNGRPYSRTHQEWDGMDYSGMQLVQNAIFQAPLALGNAKVQASAPKAA